MNGYATSQRINDGGTPILVHYIKNDSSLAYVAMKRKINETHFDLCTPYGYGGALVRNSSKDFIGAFKKVFQGYCLENNIVSEFIRFSPFLGNHINMENYCDVVLAGNMVTIDLQSYEVLWKNLKDKCRNRIRKAQKNGIVVRHDCTYDSLMLFIELYNETMDRNNATNYYYFSKKFYENLYEQLRDYMELFYAIYEGEVISSYMVFYNQNGAHCHLGSTKSEYIKLSPANLVIYEAAKWGSERGIPFLHLGGGVGLQDDQLLRFKKTFNKGPLSKYYIGKKILNQEEYIKLVELRSRCDSSFNKDTTFFPAYRS